MNDNGIVIFLDAFKHLVMDIWFNYILPLKKWGGTAYWVVYKFNPSLAVIAVVLIGFAGLRLVGDLVVLLTVPMQAAAVLLRLSALVLIKFIHLVEITCRYLASATSAIAEGCCPVWRKTIYAFIWHLDRFFRKEQPVLTGHKRPVKNTEVIQNEVFYADLDGSVSTFLPRQLLQLPGYYMQQAISMLVADALTQQLSLAGQTPMSFMPMNNAAPPKPLQWGSVLEPVAIDVESVVISPVPPLPAEPPTLLDSPTPQRLSAVKEKPAPKKAKSSKLSSKARSCLTSALKQKKLISVKAKIQEALNNMRLDHPCRPDLLSLMDSKSIATLKANIQKVLDKE